MRLGSMATLGVAIACGGMPTIAAGQANPFNDTLITKARAAATMIPGELPSGIAYLKFAGSKAPISRMVETNQDSTLDAALTVFQIRYPRGWIMVDAGMAAEVDSTFPTNRSALDRVRQGLRGARLIVMTHEHQDHVAEAVLAPMAELVAAKTVLNRAQVQTLIDRPLIPAIRLTPDRARNYVVIDYDVIYPLAPGVVLIKSAGHTPGSQMVYVRTEAGREFLLVGDVAWAMAGIERRIQKPQKAISALSEDTTAVRHQLDWLSGLTQRQRVIVMNSHDETWLRRLAANGLIKDDLDLTRP